jgi:hypothetical protein
VRDVLDENRAVHGIDIEANARQFYDAVYGRR